MVGTRPRGPVRQGVCRARRRLADRQRRIARCVSDESAKPGRGQDLPHAPDRAARISPRAFREPLAEPHGGRDRPARNPQRPAPAVRAVRCSPSGTATTSKRSARARRAASKPRRESESHRSGATAIHAGRRPGPARAASSRKRRLASVTPRGGGSRPRADPGVTGEPTISKIRGSNPRSRARAFSDIARPQAERTAGSERPRQRCRAPAAAGRPSSGNVRKAPATQNSARRAAASAAWSCCRSDRTAGDVMRPPRSKSLFSNTANASAGLPGFEGKPTATGVAGSQNRAVPEQSSHRASAKSPGTRTNPHAAKKAAAEAA
jgi:hypothetical protein